MGLQANVSRYSFLEPTGYLVDWVEMIVHATNGSPFVAPLAILALSPEPELTNTLNTSLLGTLEAACGKVNNLANDTIATVERKTGGAMEAGAQREVAVYVAVYRHGAIQIVLEACDTPNGSRVYLCIPDGLLSRIRR
jgi:hypothetical protein